MHYITSRAVSRFWVGGALVASVLVPVSFALASVSVSLQSLSPSTNISVGTALSFTLAASGFSSPLYTVSDSFSGTSVSTSNINSAGYFSWTPSSNQVGTHNLTLAVSDASGNSATTTEQITVSAAPSVSVQSLSPSSSITVGQTVSFTASTAGFSSPTYSVSDSFSGSNVSNSNINSSGYFSWTPGSTSQTGTHTITIYVSDASGHSANVSVTITVQSTPTVVIQSLSPGASPTVGQTVSFTASASNFSSPTYSVSDSFSGTSVSNSNINSSGYFSWAPTSNDVGTHTITVTVIDSSGHAATASQTITVGSSGSITGTGNVSIQGLSPGTTVIQGQTVAFTVVASGFSSPVFSVSDNYSGTSVSTSNINSAGYFSWTPSSNQVGTHAITIYVNDASGHTGSVTLTLAINNPSITIASISPGANVAPNSTLTFTLSQAGFTNPSYTLSDSFSGTTITNSNINSSGYFSWTPATAQLGSHTITVYATDAYGHSASTQVAISVNNGTSVTLTAPSPSASVSAGTTVTLSTYTYGFTSPTYSLSDTFANSSISNSAINSSGYFSWTPTTADAGTHTITITANDAYGHYGSAQTTITVAGGSGSSALLLQLEAKLVQYEAQLAQLEGSSGTAATFTFSTYLAPGTTSSDVTELQKILARQGYFSGSATGYYGSLTAAAVSKFQAAHGIAQIGVVGPATRQILNQIESGTTSSSAGSTTSSTSSSSGDGYVFSNFIGYGQQSTDVKELQKKLTALGYFNGSISGYFGDMTRAAVLKFQAAQGLDQFGYVGPGTRAALNQ